VSGPLSAPVPRCPDCGYVTRLVGNPVGGAVPGRPLLRYCLAEGCAWQEQLHLEDVPVRGVL
jgi:hypothetical protein